MLDLARDNPAFRTALGDRLAQLMVDEFQDTSPIQLALFLRPHALTGRSVWVGDPKQAIYGFRGTDPELMEEITRRIHEPDALPYSWRSRRRLVDFCNAVSSQVFRKSEGNPVSLRIPEQRRESARGGLDRVVESLRPEQRPGDGRAGGGGPGAPDATDRTRLPGTSREMTSVRAVRCLSEPIAPG